MLRYGHGAGHLEPAVEVEEGFVQEGPAPPPRHQLAGQVRAAGSTSRSPRGRGLGFWGREDSGWCSVASCEARWLELQEATDFLNQVVDDFDPMLRLSLNPVVLRLDATQGASQRARTPLAVLS